MTPKETKALIKALKDAGVIHFKSGDFEVTLAANLEQKIVAEPALITPIDAPVAEDDPIKHKVEEMVSLLKLSDHDLVDRLFPDTQQEEAIDGLH